MKIVRYRTTAEAAARMGVLIGDDIQEVRSHEPADLMSPEFTGVVTPLAGAQVLAPVPLPGKLICIGLNYRDHAAEAGLPVPTVPLIFTKFPTAVIGPGETVRIPAQVTKPDWEAELGVVIGRAGSSITVERALDHVLGYTCINDVSARDVQSSETQWVRAKSFDTFAPMGPCITTTEEIPDPQSLGIRCWIGGDLVQNSSTAQMVFSVAEVIEFVSRNVTLMPGDVIATGTPPGVGVGMNPARFLRDGDEMVVEIDGIGRLSNPVSHKVGETP